VHQFEEYSLPVLGFDYSIQEMICKNLGFPPYPDCPIPLSFYPLVNIALMWFGAPLAAYLGRRNVLIGLSFWGLLLANGLLHTAGGVAQGAYNTGLWSSVILFVPLSLWVDAVEKGKNEPTEIFACAPAETGFVQSNALQRAHEGRWLKIGLIICPPTSFSDHGTSASEKIRSTPRKTFFNSIGHLRLRDWRTVQR
jgi:hypothetical protein